MRQYAMSEEMLARYHRAISRTIDDILLKIKPNLTERQRIELRQINIVVSYGENVFGVYARRKGQYKEIVVTVGFITTMEAIQDAAMIAQRMGYPSRDVLDYVDRVAGLMLGNKELRDRGLPVKRIPFFYEFVRVPDREFQSLIGSANFLNERTLLKVESLAFVIAHELGHHFLGHLGNRRVTLEDELAADEFALDLGVKSGFSPLLAIWPFMFFAYLEDPNSARTEKRTHPKTICRVARFLEVGVKVAMADQEFGRYLDRTGQRRAWIRIQRERQEAIPAREC